MKFVWKQWQDLIVDRLSKIAVLRRTINSSDRFWVHLECRSGCHWYCTRAVKPGDAVAVKLSDIPEAHQPSITEFFNVVGAKALHMMGGRKFFFELPAPGRICYLLFEPKELGGELR